MQILETDRLIINELVTEDAPFILTLTNTPEWLQFIGDRGIKTIADAENYIINGPRTSYTTYGHGLYRISVKENGEPVGICGIIKRNTLEDKDIGFALLPQYTGHGYALEAARAVLEHAQQVLGIKRIAAIVLPANTRSVQLLTKLGLAFERMISFPPNEEELMLFAKDYPLVKQT